jgi:ketosteroid isomerase-like protein
MTTATAPAPSKNETEIRAILDSWVQAVRRKDSDGLTAHVYPYVVVFGLIDPIQYTGIEAVRRRAKQWLESFHGPILYDMHELQIFADDSVAYAYSINSVRGRRADGTMIDMSWRATFCFRKQSGNWMVTHEHSSVPSHLNTGHASFNPSQRSRSASGSST